MSKVINLRKRTRKARAREALKSFSRVFPGCKRVVCERDGGVDAVICLDCGNCIFVDLEVGLITIGCIGRGGRGGGMNLLKCSRCDFTIVDYEGNSLRPCPVCGGAFSIFREGDREDETIKALRDIQAIRRGDLPD